MTDLPNPTPDGETSARDLELAALVRPEAPPDDADPSAIPAAPAVGAQEQPVGGRPAADETAPASEPGATAGDATPEAGANATEPVVDVTSAATDSTSPDPD